MASSSSAFKSFEKMNRLGQIHRMNSLLKVLLEYYPNVKGGDSIYNHYGPKHNVVDIFITQYLASFPPAISKIGRVISKRLSTRTPYSERVAALRQFSNFIASYMFGTTNSGGLLDIVCGNPDDYYPLMRPSRDAEGLAFTIYALYQRQTRGELPPISVLSEFNALLDSGVDPLAAIVPMTAHPKEQDGCEIALTQLSDAVDKVIDQCGGDFMIGAVPEFEPQVEPEFEPQVEPQVVTPRPEGIFTPELHVKLLEIENASLRQQLYLLMTSV